MIRSIWTTTLTLQLIAASAAYAAAQDPLEILQGSYPDPVKSEGHVALRNISDKSAVCSLKMTGVISGQYRGSTIKAHLESELVQGVSFSPDQERAQVFQFQQKVEQMRSFWGDANAILTEILPDSLVANCEFLATQPDYGTTLGKLDTRKGAYMLVNGYTANCLALNVPRDIEYHGGYENGVEVIQSECPDYFPTTATLPFWRLRAEADGLVRLESDYSAKCLDLDTANGGLDSSARIQQFDCWHERSSNLSRNWRLVPTTQLVPWAYTIVSAYSGLCLENADRDSEGFPSRNGPGKLHQAQCDSNNRNQRWQATKVRD